MRTALIKNLVFDKELKTVTFSDMVSVDKSRLVAVIDTTNGVQVFSNKLSTHTGTVATNVLTLLFDTNTSTFNNTDTLIAEYNVDNLYDIVAASAPRTLTGSSAEMLNLGAKGATFVIDVTAFSGTTPAMTVKIQVKDEVSGVWIDMPGATTTSLTATGTVMIVVHPGITVAANASIATVLPRKYRATWTISGTTPSFTFSVGANYINQ